MINNKKSIFNKIIKPNIKKIKLSINRLENYKKLIKVKVKKEKAHSMLNRKLQTTTNNNQIIIYWVNKLLLNWNNSNNFKSYSFRIHLNKYHSKFFNSWQMHFNYHLLAYNSCNWQFQISRELQCQQQIYVHAYCLECLKNLMKLIFLKQLVNFKIN